MKTEIFLACKIYLYFSLTSSLESLIHKITEKYGKNFFSKRFHTLLLFYWSKLDLYSEFSRFLCIHERQFWYKLTVTVAGERVQPSKIWEQNLCETIIKVARMHPRQQGKTPRLLQFCLILRGFVPELEWALQKQSWSRCGSK